MSMRRDVAFLTRYGVLAVVLTVALVLSFAGAVQAKEAYKVGAIFAVTGRASFLGGHTDERAGAPGAEHDVEDCQNARDADADGRGT